MASYKDLKSLMLMAVKWEQRLTEFYEQAENAVTFDGSIEILAMLKKNHDSVLKIVSDIKIEDYGSDEWIKSSPEIDVERILTLTEVDFRPCGPEITSHILEFEENVRDFYRTIADKIVSISEKELFQSLVALKEKQLFEMNRLLGQHEYFEKHTN